MIVLLVSTGLVHRLVNELNFVAEIVVDNACRAFCGAFRGLLVVRFPRSFVHWEKEDE